MRILTTLKHLKPTALAQLVGSALIMSAGSLAYAAVPNVFSSGTTISSSQMNANFTTVESQIAAPNVTGNITMVPAAATAGTATAGVILRNYPGVGLVPFMHDYGTNNTFLGQSAGNFTATLGAQNTGIGTGTLNANTTGGNDTAIGSGALQTNTTGYANTAIGQAALGRSSIGNSNTAVGFSALMFNSSGSGNVALGNSAGLFNPATSSNNVDIGSMGGGLDSGVIRIGTSGTQTQTFIAGITGVTTGGAAVAVFVDANGQLGTVSSSRRFKDDIADMGAASDVLMKFRPVTFHYKVDSNHKERPLQYGLIAEEVAQVAPQLVAHSANGQIETVYYQHLAPMLLNEYQKQQRTIKAQAVQLQSQEAQLKLQSAQLAQQTERVAVLEKQGRELVVLKRELGRMSAALARMDGSQKVAFTEDH